MRGTSSYSELLRDMVEDEFEMTIGCELLNKVTINPFKLRNKEVSSLL